MTKRYYFDTAIWLDFFENRDEPNLPKGEWATQLINKVMRSKDVILVSDLNLKELEDAGYSKYEMKRLFLPVKLFIEYVFSTDKQFRRSKDISFKRKIPKKDALHALIARDNNTILVALDRHFKEMIDIIKPCRPQDLI